MCLQVYERLLEHQDQVKKKKASGKTQNLATVVYQVNNIVHVEFCCSRDLVSMVTKVTPSLFILLMWAITEHACVFYIL